MKPYHSRLFGWHRDTHMIAHIAVMYPETHVPFVPHICVSESGKHWFRSWFAAYSGPSHYLNQWWAIIDKTFRNKFQWNLIKIQIFSFRKMRLKMSSVIWQPFCPRGDWLNFRPKHKTVRVIHIILGFWNKTLVMLTYWVTYLIWHSTE